jgi:hypothetical protein
MKTVISLHNIGGELSRVELKDDDCTTQDIAQATIDLIQSCMSLCAGDTIKIREHD